jgi:tetratricopeptide (TPR) repeat protein
MTFRNDKREKKNRQEFSMRPEDESGGSGKGESGRRARPGSGDRDYAALGVLALLLVALGITGYFSFRTLVKDYDFRTEDMVKEWVRNIEERVNEWLGQTTRLRKGETGSAREHLIEGYRLYRLKRYSKALDEFNRSIELNAKNPEAYYWRGSTLINQGRLENALEDFRQAVKLKPDYAEAYDLLGWLFDRLGDPDKGIESLSKSIAMRPDNGWAYYQRGRMLFKKGDRDHALKDVEEACKLGFREGCKAYESYKSGS